MVAFSAGWDREGPGDGTGVSRHCTAYCVLYASPVLHGKTDGCTPVLQVVRDTPKASSTTRTRADSEASGWPAGHSGYRALWAASSSGVLRPVTAHEGSIVTWWGGGMGDEGSVFGRGN